jgi:ribosome-binding protein aMBF1 (putative translation factor)
MGAPVGCELKNGRLEALHLCTLSATIFKGLSLMPPGRANSRPSRKLLDLLSHNVRDRRKALEWTQADLAMRLRVHKTLIARIEQGRSNITIGTLEQLAKALGVAAVDLLAP